jgi:hypothetical protein
MIETLKALSTETSRRASALADHPSASASPLTIDAGPEAEDGRHRPDALLKPRG